MKTRLVSVWLAVILLIGNASVGVSADDHTVLWDTLTARLQAAGASTVQEWLDGELTQTAGTGAEWTVMEFARDDWYDVSAYRAALEEYLDDAQTLSAVSRQKYALALTFTGGDEAYIRRTIGETIGEQGVMSVIYGLHLCNAAQAADAAEKTKEQLLSLQLSDGGFAVSGEVSDVDVTAMALQAFAPHTADPAVQAAVDKALAMLSSRQLPDGDFASYGVPNAESTAQVIMALSALGIDAATDDRFIKNGCSPLEGLSRYALGNGMYRHCDGRQADAMASTQALCALLRHARTVDPSVAEAVRQLVVAVPTETTAPAAVVNDTAGGYRLPVCIGVAVLAVGAIVWLVFIRKRSARNAAVIAVAALLVIGAVLLIDIRSADEYYTSEPTTKETVGSVTLTIRCDTVADKGASHIPANGELLHTVSMPIAEGDTVYTILISAAKANGLAVAHDGGYIRGIAGLYETDYGDLSGWLYHVNGEEPSVACDRYILSEGDVIEWLYTCEMGRDL